MLAVLSEQPLLVQLRIQQLAQCWQKNTHSSHDSTFSSLRPVSEGTAVLQHLKDQAVAVCAHTCCSLMALRLQCTELSQCSCCCACASPETGTTAQSKQIHLNRQGPTRRALQNRSRAITPLIFARGTGTAVHTEAVKS